MTVCLRSMAHFQQPMRRGQVHLTGVPSDQFDRCTVCHLDMKMSGEDMANVMDLAGLPAHDGSYRTSATRARIPQA
jgi:hypothetical protein